MENNYFSKLKDFENICKKSIFSNDYIIALFEERVNFLSKSYNIEKLIVENDLKKIIKKTMRRGILK